MAYDKKKIFDDAIRISKEKKCFFVEQLVSFLPIAKKTFYEWYPIGSNESNAIKDSLNENKVEVKTAMYNKWFNSSAPALQISLMKLIATDEEAHRLNGSRKILEGGEKPIQTIVHLGSGIDPNEITT
jgi:hypothetical protein